MLGYGGMCCFRGNSFFWQGVGWSIQAEEPMDARSIKLALQSMLKGLNTQYEEATKEAQEHNAMIRTRLEDGEITEAEAVHLASIPPKKPRGKISYTAVKRFQDRFQWKSRAIGMTCNFLPYDDPRVQQVRDEVATLISTRNVHERLVVNYDQVWEMLCHGAKSKVWKDKGVGSKDTLEFCGGDAKHNHLKSRMRAAAEALQEMEVSGCIPKKSKDNWVAGPMPTPRNDKVKDHRVAHTVLTVSFIDGTPGLLVLAFRAGDIPDNLVSEFNSKFAGSVYILVTKTASHMFDGSLTVDMWEECMTAVFRKRRQELGLTAEARGLILCDAFTGNSSNKQGESQRRDAWMASQNVQILTSIPGGWSAHGQPNDAVHQYLRYLQKIYESVALEIHPNPLIRPRLESMTSTHVQIGQRGLTARQLIEKDLWAWWHMPPSLMRWAWISRGYVSVEKMAEWHGMTVEALKQDGKSSEEQRKSLLEMTSMPALVPKFDEDTIKLLEAPLPGETKRVWLTPETALADSEWQVIPNRVSLAMERELAKFRKELSMWNDKVEKGLKTAKQREKYEHFTSSTRQSLYSIWCEHFALGLELGIPPRGLKDASKRH